MTNRKITTAAAFAVGGAGLTVIGIKACNRLLRSPNRQAQSSFPITKAGHPDPQDLRDNNMVSEGSQFPVQYYSERES